MFELKITATTPEELDSQLLALVQRLQGAEKMVQQDITQLQQASASLQPSDLQTPDQTPPASTQAGKKSKHTKKETQELAKALSAQGADQDKAVQAIMEKMSIGSLTALQMDQVDEFHERLSAAKAHFHVQATNAANAAVQPQTLVPPQPPATPDVQPPATNAADMFSGWSETPATQPPVTKPMLMALITKLVGAGLQPQANQVVTSMGYSNMSFVPEERYAEVYSQLQALEQ